MDSIEKNLYRLVWLSRPLHQEAETAVINALPDGVTVRMRAVLEALSENGASTVPAVARALSIKRQYVQVMMNELLVAGLAQPQDNPGHKRSPLYALSDSGAALIFKLRSGEQKMLHQLAKGLDATQVGDALKTIQEVLKRFQVHNQDHET